MTVTYVVSVGALQIAPSALWTLPAILAVRLATLVLSGSYRHEGPLAGRREIMQLVIRFVMGAECRKRPRGRIREARRRS